MNKEKEKWPDRPEPITWGEFKIDRVIDLFLESGEVGVTIGDISGETNIPPRQVDVVVKRLVREEFLIKDEHWLLQDQGYDQYKLNLEQKVEGQEESEAGEAETSNTSSLILPGK